MNAAATNIGTLLLPKLSELISITKEATEAWVGFSKEMADDSKTQAEIMAERSKMTQNYFDSMGFSARLAAHEMLGPFTVLGHQIAEIFRIVFQNWQNDMETMVAKIKGIATGDWSAWGKADARREEMYAQTFKDLANVKNITAESLDADMKLFKQARDQADMDIVHNQEKLKKLKEKLNKEKEAAKPDMTPHPDPLTPDKGSASFTGFAEMWKGVQSNLAGGGSLLGVAQAHKAIAEKGLAVAERTFEAINNLGKNAGPGVAIVGGDIGSA
jgi:hypothetical protein